MHHGNGREVEDVAGRRVEAADAPLTQDHRVIPLGEQVLGGEQQLLDRCRQPALEEHGLLRAPRGLEERGVLHVAGTDLNDVGDFGDVSYPLGVHGLGADQQSRLVACFREELETRLSERVAIRRGQGSEVRKDKETRRRGDKEIRVPIVSPCLLVLLLTVVA